jgi:hypothetical protein
MMEDRFLKRLHKKARKGLRGWPIESCATGRWICGDLLLRHPPTEEFTMFGVACSPPGFARVFRPVRAITGELSVISSSVAVLPDGGWHLRRVGMMLHVSYHAAKACGRVMRVDILQDERKSALSSISWTHYAVLWRQNVRAENGASQHRGRAIIARRRRQDGLALGRRRQANWHPK